MGTATSAGNYNFSFNTHYMKKSIYDFVLLQKVAPVHPSGILFIICANYCSVCTF